jgi:hypothetical protein
MAGNIKLDLKQFKHVKSDDKGTTLQHADGHQLTLAHKALSPEAQAQLKALAGISKDAQTSNDSQEKQAEAKTKMADGGPVADPSQTAPSAEASASVPAGGVPAATEQPGLLDQAGTLFRKAFDPKDKGAAFAAGSQPSREQVMQYLQENPPTPEEMAQWQNNAMGMTGAVKMVGPAAVEANTAAEGLQALGSAHRPVGGVVNVVKPPTTNFGKVTVYKAEGGEVKEPVKMADGGGTPEALDPNAQPTAPADPVSQLYTTDPNQAMPAIEQAYQRGTEGAVKAERGKLGLMNLMNTPGATGVDTPQELDLQALNEVQHRQDTEAIDRKMADNQRKDLDTQIAAKRAALGLPADLSTVPQDAKASVDQAPPTPGLAPQSQTAQQPGMQGPGDTLGMMQQGFNSQIQGINQQATAQGQLGQQESQVLEQQVQAQQEAKQTYQQNYAELERERQAHMADIKAGHIDPEKYWDNHSKIASGIGMILAGFNPTSSPNAAVNFLKFQMEQNINAQAKNLDSDQNLLQANLRQFGNLKDATDMTRVMQSDIVANQLKDAAAKAQTPMAKAAALQAAGKLEMDAAPMFQNLSMRQSMMKLANNPNGQTPQAVEQMLGYLRVTNPEMAKEMESRYVPGVGMGSVPIAPDVRAELTGKKQFDQLAQHYMKFAQEHAGSLNPAVQKQGAALAAELQGAYRQASKGGVFKEGEQSFIERLIPSDPTQFASSIRTLPKIKELIANNNMQLNTLARSVGLPAQQQTQSQEPQIKIVNGIKYMRGPDGKAIQVK